ncbi:MAG: hypothetical protein R3F19_07565 [Verrucomicrobiales bacterium]
MGELLLGDLRSITKAKKGIYLQLLCKEYDRGMRWSYILVVALFWVVVEVRTASGLPGDLVTSFPEITEATAFDFDAEGRAIVLARIERFQFNYVFRFGSDHSLDETFLPKARCRPGTSGATLSVMADGSIVVGDTRGLERITLEELPSSIVNKLAIDGRFSAVPDRSSFFGFADGMVKQFDLDGTPIAGFESQVRFGPSSYTNLILDGAGRVLVAAQREAGGGISRLRSDGSLDPTFNIHPGILSPISALAVQADGKILAGGWDPVFRLHDDGTFDNSFQPMLPSGDISCIAVDSVGRSLVGLKFGGADAVVRLLPDGSMDPTFQRKLKGYGLALKIRNGSIFVAGEHLEFDGKSVSGLVELEGGGGLVIAEPSIIRQPLNTRAKELQRSVLRASFRNGGDDNVMLQWIRNDVAIPGANSPELVFESVRLENSGFYRLEITNQSGRISTRTVELQVLPATPEDVAGALSPVATVVEQRPAISFDHLRQLQSISYIVESSSDLKSWSTVWETSEGLEAPNVLNVITGNNAWTLTVAAPLHDQENDQVFLRVRAKQSE